jgi:hypothetical protein
MIPPCLILICEMNSSFPAAKKKATPAIRPVFVYNTVQAVRGEALGRQEDAEEFLVFVLTTLHDELVKAMRSQGDISKAPATPEEEVDGWSEVGRKGIARLQKVTRVHMIALKVKAL